MYTGMNCGRGTRSVDAGQPCDAAYAALPLPSRTVGTMNHMTEFMAKKQQNVVRPGESSKSA
jgi:hypothetical protein